MESYLQAMALVQDYQETKILEALKINGKSREEYTKYLAAKEIYDILKKRLM